MGTKLPDEVVALPTAMLQAGFAGVCGSLWSVADISTAMLMVRFYRLWRVDGLTPAQPCARLNSGCGTRRIKRRPTISLRLCPN